MLLEDKKVSLLEIALEEGALTLDYGLDIYTSKSNVSRAVGSLVEDQFLIEKKPPEISKYQKVWILTDKARNYLTFKHTEDEN